MPPTLLCLCCVAACPTLVKLLWHGDLGIPVYCPQRSCPVLPAPCCWPPTFKVSALCTSDWSDWLSTPWGRGSACATGTKTRSGVGNLMLLAGPCVGCESPENAAGECLGQGDMKAQDPCLFAVGRFGLLCESS